MDSINMTNIVSLYNEAFSTSLTHKALETLSPALLGRNWRDSDCSIWNKFSFLEHTMAIFPPKPQVTYQSINWKNRKIPIRGEKHFGFAKNSKNTMPKFSRTETRRNKTGVKKMVLMCNDISKPLKALCFTCDIYCHWSVFEEHHVTFNVDNHTDSNEQYIILYFPLLYTHISTCMDICCCMRTQNQQLYPLNFTTICNQSTSSLKWFIRSDIFFRASSMMIYEGMI